MKKCIHCGIEINENAKFCSECGTKNEFEPLNENILKKEIKRCSHCGSEVGTKVNFCTVCGISTHDATVEYVPISEKVDHQEQVLSRKCMTCGDTMDVNVRFCQRCGTNMDGGKTAYVRTNYVNNNIVKSLTGEVNEEAVGGAGFLGVLGLVCIILNIFIPYIQLAGLFLGIISYVIVDRVKKMSDTARAIATLAVVVISLAIYATCLGAYVYLKTR